MTDPSLPSPLKVAGLSEDDAWRRFVLSLTSAAGIVKNLGYVEQGWFRTRLAGEAGMAIDGQTGE